MVTGIYEEVLLLINRFWDRLPVARNDLVPPLVTTGLSTVA